MAITQNGVLQRDDNDVPVSGGVSSTDGETVLNFNIDPITGRLLVDMAGGSGTVTSVSVVTANGFAGSVANPTTTPAITLSTTITGMIKGNGTALLAATAQSDYTDRAFSTISVSGQSDVVADSAGDTLTLVAGTGMTITTGPTTDSIVFSSSSSGGTVTSVSVVTANGFAGSVADPTTTPAITLSTTTSGILKGINTQIMAATPGSDYTSLAFKTISVSGQSDVVADVPEDTLTLVAGTGVTITTGASTDSVVISATGTGGTVTTVSVVTANGFAGSVANATTTPAITLTTTTSGILKGVNTQIMAATAESDYLAPIFSIPTVDGTATGGRKTSDFNAGYSTTAIGDLVYLDSAATWQKASATGTSVPAYSGHLAIALSVVTSGNPLLVALPGNYIYSTAFTTFTTGSPIYMSTTAGAMQVAQPSATSNIIRVMGWGVQSSKLYFFPSPDYIMHT